jgi:hypothetical protein
MKKQEQSQMDTSLSTEDIEKCLHLLEQLTAHTELLFEIDAETRIALIKAAGMLSRPSRDEFSRRKKDGKTIAKRKL